MKKRMNFLNQKLFWLFLLVFLGVVLFLGASFLIEPTIFEVETEITTEPELQVEDNEITVFMVGDIMLNRGVEYMIEKKGEGDFKFPFLKIADYLKEADILFGNLESIISDKGYKAGSIYSFRAEPEAINGLTYAGFNVLSLANNHAFDYTRKALEDTFSRLKDAGISYVGAGLNNKEAFSPLIKEIKDTEIGFLAYTNLGPEIWQAGEQNSGIAWINSEDFSQIKEDIEKAKKETDVLIVSLHAGEEYENNPSQFQIDFAKIAIDSGADLVIGHHPHVVQPLEKYDQGYVAYSLGNFVFDQSFSEETMKGILLKVIIEDSQIKKVIPVGIQINDFFQPEI